MSRLYVYAQTSLSGETLPLPGWPAYILDGETVTPDYSPGKRIGTYLRALAPGHFGMIALFPVENK